MPPLPFRHSYGARTAPSRLHVMGVCQRQLDGRAHRRLAFSYGRYGHPLASRRRFSTFLCTRSRQRRLTKRCSEPRTALMPSLCCLRTSFWFARSLILCLVRSMTRTFVLVLSLISACVAMAEPHRAAWQASTSDLEAALCVFCLVDALVQSSAERLWNLVAAGGGLSAINEGFDTRVSRWRHG